jgi:predicted enzyme related to lactoylglutathione lyase
MRLTPGTFGWVDLQTPDVPAAKAFYTGLFGWAYQDMATDMGPDYTTCLLGDDRVCGMGPLPAEMAAMGVPPSWTSYAFVADADATVAAAEAAGGSITMPVMDIMDQGRMALIAGPDGAVMGVWQPLEHDGATVFDAPGAVTWNELQSRNLSAARTFLSTVFGWHWESQQPGDLEYWVAHLDQARSDQVNDIGGAMNMPDNVPPEAPSMWVVYFAVEDCDASAAKVAALGGSLFLPPMEMGPGTFAGATDPTGAMFFFGSFPEPA